MCRYPAAHGTLNQKFGHGDNIVKRTNTKNGTRNKCKIEQAMVVTSATGADDPDPETTCYPDRPSDTGTVQWCGWVGRSSDP